MNLNRVIFLLSRDVCFRHESLQTGNSVHTHYTYVPFHKQINLYKKKCIISYYMSSCISLFDWAYAYHLYVLNVCTFIKG